MAALKNWSDQTAYDADEATTYQYLTSSPNGWPEGMAPSDVNNAARNMMAAIRTFYNTLEWREWGHTIAYVSGTSFTTAVGDGDTTGVYLAERRIRAVGSTTNTIYGKIVSSAHASQTTVTVVWDSGSLQNEALTISLGMDPTGSTVAKGWETGDFRFTTRTTAATGWVMLSDNGSIGSGASGATNRANDDTEALWKHLYDTYDDTLCPVSGGRTTRDADWTANKTLSLIDWSGRALGLAGAGASLTVRAAADKVGTETHTLTSGEIPDHTHQYLRRDGGGTGSLNNAASISLNPMTATDTTNGGGVPPGGGAHNNMQPTVFLNGELKL